MNSKRSIFQYIKSRNETSASLLLLLLLAADFFFIVLHIIHQRNIPVLRSPLYDIGTDRGYAEAYQYVKYFWILILFVYIIKRTKCINYISWIVVFIYFLCDDSIQIHEKLGGYIATKFHFIPPFHLRLQDYGELVVYASVGTLLLIILAWAYFRGSQIFRKISMDLAVLMVALVFFGVFLDMAEVGVNAGWFVEQSLGIIEDGGEMVVISVTLWYVFLLASKQGNSDMYISDYLIKSLKKHKS